MASLGAGAALRTFPTQDCCTVETFLGGGGQGEVYQADMAGHPVAVKWYLKSSATVYMWRSLERLASVGPPDARFLWPLALVTSSGQPPAADGEQFGYVMPLREPRFRSLSDLLARSIKPTLFALATAGFQLADSYRNLHGRGEAYRDISRTNVFLDPDTGDIAICDNDNVSVDGLRAEIQGTPDFMAPEILLGEASPSRATDLWSLAVLLFYFFVNHHPLLGRAELDIHVYDAAARRRLLARRPVFIFDPADESNRPVAGVHDAPIALWPIYPKFLHDLFIRAFTKGIRNPSARIGESEWKHALAQLRDGIFPCPSCREQNLYDPSLGSQGRCIRCRRSLPPPARLRLGGKTTSPAVVLQPDTKLYPHHLDPARRYDFSVPLAEMSQNPARPGQWGLRNLSEWTWTFTGQDGTQRTVSPGQSVPLVAGRRVGFGRVDGEMQTSG
jgi:serine/threonine protein kinase